MLDKKPITDEAENALVQLGFTRVDAKQAVAMIPENIKGTEERVKFALKNLGK
jgi:Holliday junction resolvasome RuvABC DNA-binding subunit